MIEQCDDANTTDNDGCSASCQIEYPRCVWVASCW
jgi:cysteine-rich repeat protein